MFLHLKPGTLELCRGCALLHSVNENICYSARYSDSTQFIFLVANKLVVLFILKLFIVTLLKKKKRSSGKEGGGTGNVCQQSQSSENSVLFVPVLAASFSPHAQNVDWGGERVLTVLGNRTSKAANFTTPTF